MNKYCKNYVKMLKKSFNSFGKSLALPYNFLYCWNIMVILNLHIIIKYFNLLKYAISNQGSLSYVMNNLLSIPREKYSSNLIQDV